MGRRKKTNAGASSMDRFRMMRRAEMRANWRDWLGIVIACACAVAAILFGDGWLRVGAAWFLGAFMTLAFVGWTIGGHVSSLTWLWGAAAERDTAEELAKLPDGWAQIHDVDNGRGNWDHVVIGPGGVFLIDSKFSSRRVEVAQDCFRSGRLRTDGSVFRGAAAQLKEALESESGSRVWVQAVVAIWADFPQQQVEENRVVYLDASQLAAWLTSQPVRLEARLRRRLADAAKRLAEQGLLWAAEAPAS